LDLIGNLYKEEVKSVSVCYCHCPDPIIEQLQSVFKLCVGPESISRSSEPASLELPISPISEMNRQVNDGHLIVVYVDENNDGLTHALQHIKNQIRVQALGQYRLNIKILAVIEKSCMKDLPELVNLQLVDFIVEAEAISAEVLEPVLEWFEAVTKQSDVRTPSQTVFLEDVDKIDGIFKEMLTMEYIYDLIYGYASRIKQFKFLETLYPLESPHHVVLLLMVDDFWKICERLDNKQRYGVKRRIMNVVRTTLKDRNEQAITTSLIGTDKIIVLANLSFVSEAHSRDYVENLGRALIEDVNKMTRYSIKIGISNTCKSYNEIWKAYEQSFQTLSHAFTFEKGVILHYTDLFTDKALDLLLLNETDRFEFELTKLISKNNQKDIEITMNEWCSFLVANHYSEETIKSIFTKLIFNLLEYTLNIGLDSGALSKDSVDTTVAILKSNSLAGIHQIVSAYVLDLSRQVSLACERGCLKGFEAAIGFIHTYYYENLALDEISKVANMSPSYFCRKFKEIYGKNYVKYLTEYRIEKSRQLILESDMSLSEIASRVGINDLSYFSKRFKEHMGLTPNQFRRTVPKREPSNKNIDGK
jgi:AraC-like DNA-binding protein